MPSGYSDTPLGKKLSLKDGLRVWWDGIPLSVREEIETEGYQLDLLQAPESPIDAGHVFVTSRDALRRKLRDLRPLLSSAGFLWVSWPKKSSGVPSEITEDTIRELCLPMGLVDVKVCAVNQTWSGLKLVVRKELR